MYLKHNHYSTHADENFGGPNSRVQALGYREKIDKFFSSRLRDPSTDTPLKQEMPRLMADLLEHLAHSDKPGRADVASYVLDLRGDWRTNIFDHLEQEVERSIHSRPRSISTQGDVKLTLAPWTRRWGDVPTNDLLDHVKSIILLHDESDRRLIVMEFDDQRQLSNVVWKAVKHSEISFLERPRLLKMAESVREERIQKAVSNTRRVGRNEQCPCGSGKKFKKCCIEKVA